jgi:hypothetical protein
MLMVAEERGRPSRVYRSDRTIFRTRYNEHLQIVTNYVGEIGCAQYVLCTGHACVKLGVTLNAYETEKKHILNVLEKSVIYRTVE